MAHIPYYGEDITTPCGKLKNKRSNAMVLNYEQLIEHNKKFYDSFVDLKVAGWKTYSKATNAYTFNFFKTQMETMDSTVEKLGNIMKGNYNDA